MCTLFILGDARGRVVLLNEVAPLSLETWKSTIPGVQPDLPEVARC